MPRPANVPGAADSLARPIGGCETGDIVTNEQELGPHNGLEIGIDTGGTFTDAAVLGGSTVLASAKALTTKGDLAIGVSEALHAVLLNPGVSSLESAAARFDLAAVTSISVSTTLATNAVVEGHGDRVGVLLIGFDTAMVERIGVSMAFPDCPVSVVAGGHTHAGLEREPLDTDSIRRFVTGQTGLRAIAIASLFAVRNPEHERAAAGLIQSLVDLPVTMSSELTGELDAPRRALTAVLNARLVGRITDLVSAVEQAADSLGLRCPIFIVKGDGTRALAGSVKHHPIETVMSGPAASTIGAAGLSGLADCIVSDVGGTTTDVALLRGGRAVINPDGASVGGWRTLVRAVHVRTHGLGGDSEVSNATSGPLIIGPQRAVPVSLLAVRHPNVLGLLERDVAETDTANADQGRFVALPFGTRAEDPGDTVLLAAERELLALLGAGPVALRSIATSSRRAATVAKLRKRGLLVVSALTVADAAHVLGRQQTWSTEAAEKVVHLAARLRFMKTPSESDVKGLAQMIMDHAITNSTLAVMETALDGTVPADLPVLRKIANGETRAGQLRFQVMSDVPIVAVGGPAPVLYAEVGQRLHTEVVLPEHGAVANAVGAAMSPIEATVRIEIDHTDSEFRVLSSIGARSFATLDDAIGTARQLCSEYARSTAVERGAVNIEVTVTEDRTYLPGRDDDNGLLMAVIASTAVGHRPLADRLTVR
jgi:N-methylhydantoinase A/oxoprolinase/acetone carboxylase beta subunit